MLRSIVTTTAALLGMVSPALAQDLPDPALAPRAPLDAEPATEAEGDGESPRPLEEGRARMEDGDWEGALILLEAAEQEETGERRAEARLLLARVFAELGQPGDRRYYLMVVEQDRLASPAQRAAARDLLEPDTGDDAETDDDADFDHHVDPLAIVGITFAGLEVALLLTGAILRAESNCVDDPIPCSSTMRHVSLGFLVAGSLWWIVPAVLGAAVGILSGNSGVAPLSERPGEFRF